MGLPYTNSNLPYAHPAARCRICNGQYGGVVDGLCLHHQPLTTAPDAVWPIDETLSEDITNATNTLPTSTDSPV